MDIKLSSPTTANLECMSSKQTLEKKSEQVAGSIKSEDGRVFKDERISDNTFLYYHASELART